MSIYGSLAAPSDDEHEDGCAIYVEESPGCFTFSGNPCDCGLPQAPIIYQGSHLLPSMEDPRGGFVDIALIPAHVRYWRENPDAPIESEPDFPPEPFIRFGVNGEVVVLDERAVTKIHKTLGWWIGAREGRIDGE